MLCYRDVNDILTTQVITGSSRLHFGRCHSRPV